MVIFTCILGSLLGASGAVIGLFGFGFSVWNAAGFYCAASLVSFFLSLVWAMVVAHSPHMPTEASESL